MVLRAADATEITGSASIEPTRQEERCALRAVGATEPSTEPTRSESRRARRRYGARRSRIEAVGATEPNGQEFTYGAMETALLRADGAWEPIQRAIINGRVYSPGCLGWVQCYWCRRWRFIRCLVSNQCRRWTFTGTEWRFIYCWEIHSWLCEHCLALPSALHAMESMEEPESVWAERGDGVIHECVIQPLTRTIIDGRVYSPGLLGWLQYYWCWRRRFTRCSVSDPLCDRCLDLNEPPWYPNNKQRAVLYFQRTLRQQADNYSRVFAGTETTSRQLQSCILYLQAEEEEAHVSSEQDVDSPRPMLAAVRPTASNCWRECLKLWRPPEAC